MEEPDGMSAKGANIYRNIAIVHQSAHDTEAKKPESCFGQTTTYIRCEEQVVKEEGLLYNSQLRSAGMGVKHVHITEC